MTKREGDFGLKTRGRGILTLPVGSGSGVLTLTLSPPPLAAPIPQHTPWSRKRNLSRGSNFLGAVAEAIRCGC